LLDAHIAAGLGEGAVDAGRPAVDDDQVGAIADQGYRTMIRNVLAGNELWNCGRTDTTHKCLMSKELRRSAVALPGDAPGRNSQFGIRRILRPVDPEVSPGDVAPLDARRPRRSRTGV